MTKSKIIIGAAALTAAGIAGGGIGAGIMAAAPVSDAKKAGIETAYSERLAGIVQIADLPPGVDRSQARAAELAGKAYSYADSSACNAFTVRFPDRRVITLTGTRPATESAAPYGVAPRDCTASTAALRWIGEPVRRPADGAAIRANGYVAVVLNIPEVAAITTPIGQRYLVPLNRVSGGFAIPEQPRSDRADDAAADGDSGRTDPRAGAGTVAPPTTGN